MSDVRVDLLSQVLGLLTPEQIKELSKFTITEKHITLTQLLLQELQGVTSEHAEIQVGDNLAQSEGSPGDESPPIAEINSSIGPVSDAKVATSLFLILERKHLEQTQKKIKKAEIMKLYRANLDVNIEQERLNKEDLSKSHNIGVLINKKQS